MDPHLRPDIEEFMRLCDQLIFYTQQHGRFSDEEGEQIAYMVREVMQSIQPDNQRDDLAAAVAFAKLASSIE